MGNRAKDFFRPTLSKIFVTLFLISWQYFYSYQLGLEYLRDAVPILAQYLASGFGLVSWNNYFIRTGSLFFVWILVAFIIFLALWVFEKAAISLHNTRVVKKYVNKPKHDYEHLLRSPKVKFSSHILANAIWVGGVILMLFALFFLSDLIEQFRFWAVDTITWNAFEAGTEVSADSVTFLALSFAVMVPIWYLVVCVNAWVFREAKIEEEEEEIIEEHYAIIKDEDGMASYQEIKENQPSANVLVKENESIHQNIEEEVGHRKKMQNQLPLQPKAKQQDTPEKTVEKLIIPEPKTKEKMGLLEKIRMRLALGPQFRERIVTPENFKRIKKINPDEKVKIVSESQGDDNTENEGENQSL